MSNSNPNNGGLEALHRLKSTEPPLFLAPSPDLSQAARLASKYVFSLLQPHCPKSPFDNLLVDEFDAEQIWQRIDIQSQPLVSNLRRELNKFEKNPELVSKGFDRFKDEKKTQEREIEEQYDEMDGYYDDDGDKMDGLDDEEEMDGLDEGEDDDDDEEEEEEEEEEKGRIAGIEDRFLKVKELEEFLEDGEARGYGLQKKKGNRKVDKKKKSEGSDEEDEEEGEDDEDDAEDEDEDEDEELGDLGFSDDDDEGLDKLGNARLMLWTRLVRGDKAKIVVDCCYFGIIMIEEKGFKSKSKPIKESEDSDFGNDEGSGSMHEEILSTHEREHMRHQSDIEQMEKVNLEPKTWTMQGEVTAAKRPKNSALEVDLDFEHNIRPAPVITEEVTATLEEIIQKRILEGRFDDVQKPATLPSKAPREYKEMDENKSKKGLAEVYEEEYVQKTDPASAPLTFSDEQKEASMLFKTLCLKLDALSHFHFAPKPVIEDMSIQANVPALALEEIAPVAISDAAILAPEEIFAGKGDIKEEAELTQEERKRRRANKKRKFKAETAKRIANKAQTTIWAKLRIIVKSTAYMSSINKKNPLTTEAAASLLPPDNMPAKTPITAAVPQLTVPGNLVLP
ncbi:LOW QUALITY PROTEIN: U3 small nucleolar ribonucleoprotein complex, subunit Mpp10 [Dillenia turbinata]|uniref:U3 small nucleolar ribonucleoprotein protein MPP10 n=1 Tax=Dillenia turbinata TaxID=194707 RepID=A0AAN8Z391_9MAGN